MRCHIQRYTNITEAKVSIVYTLMHSGSNKPDHTTPRPRSPVWSIACVSLFSLVLTQRRPIKRRIALLANIAQGVLYIHHAQSLLLSRRYPWAHRPPELHRGTRHSTKCATLYWLDTFRLVTDLFYLAIKAVECIIVQALVDAVQRRILGTRAVAPAVHVAKLIPKPLHTQLVLEPHKLT